MRELALFAGGGLGLLGTHALLGWRAVAAVEIEEYQRAVLLQRQADGILPRFPIWDDVRTFDGKPWRGRVDVVSGGFPCQPYSVAGKQLREDDHRNLWPDTARIIREVRPGFAWLENVPGLTGAQRLILVIIEKVEQLDLFGKGDPGQIMSRLRRVVRTIVGRSYFGRILGDLAEMGFDAEWGVLGAHHAGAPHKRDRVWILGYSKEFAERTGLREGQPGEERRGRSSDHGCENAADTSCPGLAERVLQAGNGGIRERPHQEENASMGRVSWWDIDPADVPDAEDERILLGERSGRDGERPGGSRTDLRGDQAEHESREWWPAKSRVGRVVNGCPNRVDRLKTVGNGQVSEVVALAFPTLWGRIKERGEEW